MAESGDQIFDAEAITKKRERKGGMEYFVKWKGYHDDENTWEDLETFWKYKNVENDEAIEEYEENQRLKLKENDAKNGTTE